MSRKRTITVIFIIAAIGVLVLCLSAYVAASTASDITLVYSGEGLSSADVDRLSDVKAQCILVLGCAVWDDNQPSPMLKDRLDAAIELYNKGAAPKLLMSGDNSRAEYSEPDCMYQYAINQGVAEEDIFLDFAGFSTYDTMYRAKAVFCVERAIVVTQKYHLFRALKIGQAIGMDVTGVSADQRKYAGRYGREIREVLARDKDFVKCIYKPEPTFLGEKINIDGDGSITHLN